MLLAGGLTRCRRSRDRGRGSAVPPFRFSSFGSPRLCLLGLGFFFGGGGRGVACGDDDGLISELES